MEIHAEHGVVLLDDEDAHFIGKRKVRTWLNPTGSVFRVTVAGKELGRLLMDPPADMDVDHINRDPLDNRRANLRVCTRSQNLANRRSWGKCGYKGVVWMPPRPGKGRGKFEARINRDGKKCYVGRAETAEDAARMYDKAAVDYWGEFAYLNFP